MHDLICTDSSGVSGRNYGFRLGHLWTLTKMDGTCSTHKVCKDVNILAETLGNLSEE